MKKFFIDFLINNFWLLLLASYPIAKKLLQLARGTNICTYCPQPAVFKLKIPSGHLLFCENCREIFKGIIKWSKKQNTESFQETKEDKNDEEDIFVTIIKKVKKIFLSILKKRKS